MSLPETMKAAIATGFGEIDANIRVVTDWTTPRLDNDDDDEGVMLIRVLACALAPGDVRVLSGKTDYVQLPKSGHPYVIGSDVSGIVVAVCPSETKFQPGDYVVSRFELPGPHGGVAEYRLVKTSLTEKCPDSISPVIAAGLPASAMAAKIAVCQYMKQGDRVLVIGGSGGVGTSVIQYAKLYGASFVAAVSTDKNLCESLGADQVIDYRTQNWWQVPEFQNKPFDVVFDMVNGNNWECGGKAGTAIKPSGTYAALLSGVQTELQVHGPRDLIRLSFEWMGRILWTRLNPKIPKWSAPDGLDLQQGQLAQLFEDVVQEKLRPVLDPASPFQFTESDVRAAMKLQKSCHAHGKVVIEIADK